MISYRNDSAHFYAFLRDTTVFGCIVKNIFQPASYGGSRGSNGNTKDYREYGNDYDLRREVEVAVNGMRPSFNRLWDCDSRSSECRRSGDKLLVTVDLRLNLTDEGARLCTANGSGTLDALTRTEMERFSNEVQRNAQRVADRYFANIRLVGLAGRLPRLALLKTQWRLYLYCDGSEKTLAIFKKTVYNNINSVITNNIYSVITNNIYSVITNNML